MASYRAQRGWVNKRGGSKYVRRAGESQSRYWASGPGKQEGNAALALLKRDIAALPLSLAHEVARQASPVLTKDTNDSFAAGVGVYGDPRPVSKMTGSPMTLVKSGWVRDNLSFATSGTIVRAILAKPYVKYLIGKFTILPNGSLPTTWQKRLDDIVQSVRPR